MALDVESEIPPVRANTRAAADPITIDPSIEYCERTPVDRLITHGNRIGHHAKSAPISAL